MLNNKVLLVVNSVYQLFTAVHMKRSILAEKEADLLVTDITAVLHTYIPRLKETGLFAQVIFGKTKEWNQKYAAAKGDTLDEGFQNASHTLRWMLNEELADYSEVYFSNFDPFIRMLACQFDRPSCEFIWYEDGFSTYVIDYLREDRAPINRHPAGGKIREKVRRVLLYEPHLALRGDHLINQALPKVDRNDQELKLLLNYIFDYQSPRSAWISSFGAILPRRGHPNQRPCIDASLPAGRRPRPVPGETPPAQPGKRALSIGPDQKISHRSALGTVSIQRKPGALHNDHRLLQRSAHQPHCIRDGCQYGHAVPPV